MADSFSEEGGVSPFPYVITTKRPQGAPGVVLAYESEWAVASLGGAAGHVDYRYGPRAGLAIAQLPEHGGTVTLPDGTEIQVTPYRWLDLAACANVHWEDTPECRAKVLDGFNARERVA